MAGCTFGADCAHLNQRSSPSVASCLLAVPRHETEPEIEGSLTLSPECTDWVQWNQRLCASVRHTDAPSGLPRVLSCLGRLSCRNTGSHLNGRHPRPVNAC